MIDGGKYQEYLRTKNNTDKNPALRVGVNTSGVAGILAIVALLWPGLLSDHTSTVILVVSAFVLPIITAILTRNKVWSIASVKELVDEATQHASEAAVDAYKKGVRYDTLRRSTQHIEEGYIRPPESL